MSTIDDKRVAQGSAANERAERYGWIRARAAKRIVGLRDGRTAQLAERCARSQARVRDWAKAYVFYEQLASWYRSLPQYARRDVFKTTIRELREKLSVDHFVQIGIALRVEVEIPLVLAYEVLCEAAEDRVGAKLAREKLEALYADNLPDRFLFTWQRFYRQALQLSSSIETPFELRELTKTYVAEAGALVKALKT